MAHYVFNPDKGKVVSAQKKGKNKPGTKQIWLDKTDDSKFQTDVESELNVDQNTGQTLPSKPTPKPASKTDPNKVLKTVIKVNSNTVKNFETDLSTDDAFLLVSDYFREVSKKKCETKTTGGVKTITFKIESGSKS